MAQLIRPVASTLGNYIVVGAATAHEAVDEVVLNTADYVESPAAPAGEVIKFILDTAIDPQSLATHGIHVVPSKDLAGGGQLNLLVELAGTSTGSEVVFGSAVFPNVLETAGDKVLTLTQAQIDAIPQADYEKTGTGSLVVRCTYTQV